MEETIQPTAQPTTSEKVETHKSETPKPATSKVNQIRGNKKFRIGIILFLMLVVGVMFFYWAKFRIYLGILFFILLAALGLESTNNDWDLEKLMQTKSFEQSKVARDSSGNVLFDVFGNTTTDSSKGKKADDYNCADFSSQPSAQAFFEKVGGLGNDMNRLDGDKDGTACESLPKK